MSEPHNPLDLTGRTIMVTGASSGIGQACAILLSQLGAAVILVARNENKLCKTLEQMSGTGHQCIAFDLNKREQYEILFEKSSRDRKLDGLVHAAGIAPIMPIQSVSSAILSSVMNINYFAFLECVKFYTKRKYSNGGCLVAISSVSARAGWVGGSAYCGSKGALDASVRSLAIELAPRKIRVNSVVPSNIRTPMLEEMLSLGDEMAEVSLCAKQPLGIGEPIDVANAVAFLLSDAARFITGTNLVVDGGYLAQ